MLSFLFGPTVFTILLVGFCLSDLKSKHVFYSTFISIAIMKLIRDDAIVAFIHVVIHLHNNTFSIIK
jgi:hypothetical protein